MAERQLSEPFVHALLECQDRLHAYIVALVMDQDEANDILQNTNVVLCQQADRLPEIKNFTAWACRIAYFEVLSSRKRQKRDKLLFDADLLDLIAEEIPRHLEKVGLYQNLLNRCLAELSDVQREMIFRRVWPWRLDPGTCPRVGPADRFSSADPLPHPHHPDAMYSAQNEG